MASTYQDMPVLTTMSLKNNQPSLETTAGSLKISSERKHQIMKKADWFLKQYQERMKTELDFLL